MGTTTSVPASDGGRFAAWTSSDGTLAIREVRKAQTRTTPVPQGCTVQAALATHVLLACRGTESNGTAWRIFHIKKNELQAVTTRYPTADAYDRIGLYWLGGETCDVPETVKCAFAYLNWRTGDYRVSRTQLDLNRRVLQRYDRKQYNTLAGAGVGFRRLVFRPKGGGREMVLSRCFAECGLTTPGISGLHVAWSERNVVYGYNSRSRVRFAWRVEVPAEQGLSLIRAVPTTRGVLVAVANSSTAPGFAGRLYEARF